MIINKSNGEITIGNTALCPNFSRDDFVASELYLDVLQSEEMSPNHHSYNIKPQKLEEYLFVIALNFEKDVLKMIDLRITKGGNLPRYEDWSLENEMELNNLHNQWLLKVVGQPPYKYEWGLIVSNYDERSAFSAITIIYYNENS